MPPITEEQVLAAAMDPSTPEKKLVRMMRTTTSPGQRLLTKHPNLPFEAWKKRFDRNEIEAWDSHHFLLFAMEATGEDLEKLEFASTLAYIKILLEPSCISHGAKELVVVYLCQWWNGEGRYGAGLFRILSDLHKITKIQRFGELMNQAKRAIEIPPEDINESAAKFWKFETTEAPRKAQMIRAALPPPERMFTLIESPSL